MPDARATVSRLPDPPLGEGLVCRFEVPFSALKAPDPPVAEAHLRSCHP